MSLYSVRLYLEPNENDVYTVTSPDIPGLVTEGRTPEEIQANVQEALQALQAAWQELGNAVTTSAASHAQKPPTNSRTSCFSLMRYRDVAKRLQNLSCRELRQGKGSHHIWINPVTGHFTAWGSLV